MTHDQLMHEWCSGRDTKERTELELDYLDQQRAINQPDWQINWTALLWIVNVVLLGVNLWVLGTIWARFG